MLKLAWHYIWYLGPRVRINKAGMSIFLLFSCSVMSDSLQPMDWAHQASLPLPSPGACSNSCPLGWWCHPTISFSVIPFSCLQSFPASWPFPKRWPKYGSFSFSISPSNEYSGLISFRIDCFPLFAVQGTPKSILQYHSSKAAILRRSAFFMVQLSPSYMTIGKTIALTRWTFVGRVTSPLFNRLSRASLVAWLVKNLPAMCLGLIPGLGRSPGEGKGYPLQYSGLENSTDCIVHGVAKSQTQLSDFHLRVFHSFSSKEQVSFNFMAAVTICSDFWSPRK